MGRLPSSETQRWIQPGQEQERARWLLVGAIAQEYPELMESLALVRSEWDALKTDVGSGAVLAMRIRSGHYPKFFTAAWQWAQKAHLIAFIPDNCTRYPLSNSPDAYTHRWALDIAIVLAGDDNCRTALTIKDACQHRTDHFWLGIRSTIAEDEPPQPPELPLSLALRSRQEFIDESVRILKAYADKVEDWYRRSGYAPAPSKSEEEKHFRWAAWYVAGGLSAEEIAVREAENSGADDPPDADWIRKRVGKIAQLTGLVKEM